MTQSAQRWQHLARHFADTLDAESRANASFAAGGKSVASFSLPRNAQARVSTDAARASEAITSRAYRYTKNPCHSCQRLESKARRGLARQGYVGSGLPTLARGDLR